MPTFEDPGALQPKDWPGGPPLVLDYLGRASRRIRDFLRTRLSLSTNIDCDVQTVRFTHGVEVKVKSRLLAPRGMSVISAASGLQVEFAKLIASGSTARVTVYFVAGSGSADVTLVLWPEGNAGGSGLTYYPALRLGQLSGTDGQVLTRDSTQPAGAKWAASSGGSGGAWSLATKPASADSRDEEFEGTAFSGWSDVGTRDNVNALDPYASFASGVSGWRHSWNSLRPGWLMMQPVNDGVRAGIAKAVTLGTNEIVYCRIDYGVPSTNITAGNSNFGLALTDSATTLTNYVLLDVNASDGAVTGFPNVRFGKSGGGSIGFSAVADDYKVARVQYLLIHKKGTTYHAWIYHFDGTRRYLGSQVQAAALSFVWLTGNGVGGVSTPGNPYGGFDFVRFKASATDLP